jgi:hypothetical protein
VEDDGGDLDYKGRKFKMQLAISEDIIAQLDRLKENFLAAKAREALENAKDKSKAHERARIVKQQKNLNLDLLPKNYITDSYGNRI